MKKRNLALLLMLIIATNLLGQQHNMSKAYQAPTDALVQQKIANWQDLKFGLFMH